MMAITINSSTSVKAEFLDLDFNNCDMSWILCFHSTRINAENFIHKITPLFSRGFITGHLVFKIL